MSVVVERLEEMIRGNIVVINSGSSRVRVKVASNGGFPGLFEGSGYYGVSPDSQETWHRGPGRYMVTISAMHAVKRYVLRITREGAALVANAAGDLSLSASSSASLSAL